MASESPIPLRERRDLVDEVKCFGPFAAASFPATANGYLKLPFLESKDAIIDDIQFQCDTVSDAVGTAFAIAQSSGGAPSGALSDANRVCANVTGSSIATTPVTVTPGVGPATRATITPGTHNNIVPGGTGLYVYTAADETAGSLVGLVIHVRYRTRRK